MAGSARLKPITIVTALVLGVTVLLVWTRQWFVLDLRGSGSSTVVISVGGEVAAPALAALGLAGLALVAALAIAGPVFRVILGFLQLSIGIAVCLSAWGAISDPVQASSSLISATTGIAGTNSVHALVTTSELTVWPWLGLAAGFLIFVLGVFMMITSRRWPVKASRYQTARFEDSDEPRSAISDWDSLSDGSDPTSG